MWINDLLVLIKTKSKDEIEIYLELSIKEMKELFNKINILCKI